jgi:hypothetical protein
MLVTKKLLPRIPLALLAGLLVLIGTNNNADAGLLRKKLQQNKSQIQDPPPQSASSSPEGQAATARVDRAKSNLDQAHKQLDAARAVLRAADAEYKAAKADSEALTLRTEAQRLADSAGLAGAPMEPVSSLKKPSSSAAPQIRSAPVYDSSQASGQPSTEERIDQTDNYNTSDAAGNGAPIPRP